MNPRILATLSFLAIAGGATAARAETPTPFRVQLGLDGALAGWMSPPNYAFEGALRAGLRWPGFSLAAEVRGSPPSGAVVRPYGIDVTTARLAGALVPCFHGNVLESREGGPFGCAVIQAGGVFASGTDVVGGTLPYAACGARVGFEMDIVGWLGARFSVDALAVVLRPEVRTERQPVWTASPVAITVGGGLVASFR